MSPLLPISNDLHEVLHAGGFFKIAEELKKKEANRIIGKADYFVLMCHNGTNKGEVNQGGNEAGEASGQSAIRMDFDMARFVGVLRQEETFEFWKGTVVLGIDMNANTVKLFDNAAHAEGSEVPQVTAPGLKVTIKKYYQTRSPKQ
jgi:hypothetical protein